MSQGIRIALNHEYILVGDLCGDVVELLVEPFDHLVVIGLTLVHSNNSNNEWLLYSANLPVKKTHCASTHRSRKYTQRHEHNLPPPPTHTHTHHGPPGFVEMPVEKGKF